MPDSAPTLAVPDSSEALLRAALERLVLLECRGGQAAKTAVTADFDALRSEARRASERATAAEAQRDRLFAQILEADRIRASLDGQAPEAGQLDLASFIAELRAELAEVQRERDVALERNEQLATQLRQASPGPRSALEWAARMRDEGLLFRADAPLGELWPELCAGSSAERLILAGAVRDLDSADPASRAAAVVRLAGLPPAVAAPVVAAALGREKEPALLGRLVRLAGRLGVASLLPLVERERQHPDARVRAAALLASIRLGGAADVRRWGADPSPRVRRSAMIAAVLRKADSALPELERLAEDPDPAVRKLLAGCAAALPERPEPLLRRLANDDDPAVRRSALRALEATPDIAGLPAAERRRRLKEAAGKPPSPRAFPSRPAEPEAEEGRSAGRRREAEGRSIADDGLEAAMEGELRASLRGRTEAELAQTLGQPLHAIERAVARATAAGRFVRRGGKLYVG